jgi:hypothetical protein
VATAAAVICKLLGVTRPNVDAKISKRALDLDFGEQLCEVHEALQACFPDADLEFEHVMLLAIGLSKHELIDLTSCVRCGIAFLSDQLSLRRRTCTTCHRPTEPAISVTAETSSLRFMDGDSHGEPDREHHAAD